MKKHLSIYLSIFSIIFAVVLLTLSLCWIIGKERFIDLDKYTINYNVLHNSILLIVITIIHSVMLYSSESKIVRVLLFVAVLPFLWAAVFFGTAVWAVTISVIIYFVVGIFTKGKLAKIATAIIAIIIILNLLFFVVVIYLPGAHITVSAEEYISLDEKYVVTVYRINHYLVTEEGINREVVAETYTDLSYRMNKSIDGIFFDLLPKEKTLAEFIPNIDEDTEPIWKSDDVFMLGEKEYHLSQYEWK